jgi:hypothetical protein
VGGERGVLGIRVTALLERQSELELSDDQLKKLLAIRSDDTHQGEDLRGHTDRPPGIGPFDRRQHRNISRDQTFTALENIYNLRVEEKQPLSTRSKGY